MARATYIYYFQNRWHGKVVAAFTVKYEALHWAERNNFSPNDFTFWRARDGIYRNADEKTPEKMKEFNLPEETK